MPNNPDVQAMLKERFAQLPKVVQNAITSSDVEDHLRKMADTHKLHIDQWEALENEVKMTLFGINPLGQLKDSIKRHVAVSDDIAEALTESISKIVFEPVRVELARELEKSENTDTGAPGVKPVPLNSVAPATPPPESPALQVTRARTSAAYKAGEPSSARASVEDDPYREPPR